jgi:hypothetical protein
MSAKKSAQRHSIMVSDVSRQVFVPARQISTPRRADDVMTVVAAAVPVRSSGY